MPDIDSQRPPVASTAPADDSLGVGEDMPAPFRSWSTLLVTTAALVAVAVLLVLVSRYSYSVFHGLIELFAASTALAIFFVTWHSRRFLDNDYVGVVGVAYLGVAAVGVLHTLAYKGTNVFPGAGSDLPTQLWLADRYIAASALLVAPLFVRKRIDLRVALAAYMAVTAGLLVAIFSGVFPRAFVEGVGLTPFKVGSEYVIVAALVGALVLLLRVRDSFDRRVLRLLAASIVMSIGAELAFTLYADPYGPANLTGHLLYAGAAFLVYRALVHVALEDPYAVLFRRLKTREEDLEVANRLSDSLTRIVSGIASTLDSQAIMQRVAVLASSTIGADSAVISSPGDGSWTIRYVLRYPASLVGRRLTAKESTHVREAVSRADVLAIPDVARSPLVDQAFAQELGIGALLTVPLIVRNEAVGVLSFHFRRPRDLRETELNFARKLARPSRSPWRTRGCTRPSTRSRRPFRRGCGPSSKRSPASRWAGRIRQHPAWAGSGATSSTSSTSTGRGSCS